MHQIASDMYNIVDCVEKKKRLDKGKRTKTK